MLKCMSETLNYNRVSSLGFLYQGHCYHQALYSMKQRIIWAKNYLIHKAWVKRIGC